MDEYLECRYKSLEETVLQIRKYIISKKLIRDDTKNKATILASWLMKKQRIDVFNWGKAGGGVQNLHIPGVGAVRQASEYNGKPDSSVEPLLPWRQLTALYIYPCANACLQVCLSRRDFIGIFFWLATPIAAYKTELHTFHYAIVIYTGNIKMYSSRGNMTAAPIRGYCPGCQLSCIGDIVSFNLSSAYSTQLLLLIIAVATSFPLLSPVFQPPRGNSKI